MNGPSVRAVTAGDRRRSCRVYAVGWMCGGRHGRLPDGTDFRVSCLLPAHMILFVCVPVPERYGGKCEQTKNRSEPDPRPRFPGSGISEPRHARTRDRFSVSAPPCRDGIQKKVQICCGRVISYLQLFCSPLAAAAEGQDLTV